LVSWPREGHPSPGSGQPGGDGGRLVYGAEWRARIASLLLHGITEPGTRHDAILKVTFHFTVERGCSSWDEVRLLLERWLRDHDHQSVTRLRRGEAQFVEECLREGEHYYHHHCQQLQRRPSKRAGELQEADHAMVAREFEPELREPATVILRLLAASKDTAGRVLTPVTLGTEVFERELGDIRLRSADGRRLRLPRVLVQEFVAKGILTLHSNYRVGSRARRYCCWYVFGSGQLPERRADGQRVLGKRQVREGELEVLSTGQEQARAQVRVASVVPETADRPNAWWRRMFERREFTPLEFFAAEEGRVLPLPGQLRRVRREPPPPTEGESLGAFTGVVETFSYARGYGFLVLEDGRRAFVHHTELALPGFRDLADGEHLAFELLQTERGLRAVRASRAEGPSPILRLVPDDPPPDEPPAPAAEPVPDPATSDPPALSVDELRRAFGCKPGCMCKLCWEGALEAPAPAAAADELRRAFGCKPGCMCKLCWEGALP
jgi:CspA family cold shock protein